MKKVLAVAALTLSLVSGLAHADAPSWHVIKTIPVGGADGWDYLTYEPSRHRLFISRGTHVQIVDVEAGLVVGDIPNTSGVHGIALDNAFGHGFTSNGKTNTVTMFDSDTWAVMSQIDVGKKPDAIIDDPATHRVFSLNGEGNSATAIDARSGKALGDIPLGGQPEYAAADGDGHVYVNLEDKSEVVEVDSHRLKVTGRWSLAPGDSPSGMGIDREHHRLFIGCHNEKMVIFDTRRHRVADTVPIGKGVDANGYDDALGLAFSSNGDGTLTVVQTFPDSVLQVVPTEPGARTMAVDAQDHRVFLVAATAAHIPTDEERKAGTRPTYLPDSFHVIVVGR